MISSDGRYATGETRSPRKARGRCGSETAESVSSATARNVWNMTTSFRLTLVVRIRCVIFSCCVNNATDRRATSRQGTIEWPGSACVEGTLSKLAGQQGEDIQ